MLSGFFYCTFPVLLCASFVLYLNTLILQGMYSLAHCFAIQNLIERELIFFPPAGFCHTYSRFASSPGNHGSDTFLFIPNFIQSDDTHLPIRLPLSNTANTPSHHTLSPKQIDFGTHPPDLTPHQQCHTLNRHSPATGIAIRISQSRTMMGSTSYVPRPGNDNAASPGCNNGLSPRSSRTSPPKSPRRISWST